MRPLSAYATGLMILASVLVSTRDASAYVHTVTPHGCNPVHWAQTCVFVTADSAGVSDLPFADVERIVQKAVDGWLVSNGPSFLRLEYVAASGPREVEDDGWQVIKFRTTSWCHPADKAGPAVCYDASATALTTVSYVNDPSDPANDGRILDADIELNAVDNYFYDADSGKPLAAGARRPADLWNTLSHELGHLQGLDHTCRGSSWSMPQCERDGDGGDVVACEVVEANHLTDPRLAAIYSGTMYPSAKASETGKRAPKADDLAGITNLYPMAEDPNLCGAPGDEAKTAPAVTPPPPKAGGCSASSSAPSWGGAWLTAFALLGVRRSRLKAPTRHSVTREAGR